VPPKRPLRRDLESTGQGTHLSEIRTTDDPRSDGARLFTLPPGEGRPGWGGSPAANRPMIGWIPPGLLLGVPLVLLLAQLFHVLWHDGRRRYLAVLLLTAAGVGLGQLWDLLGLPGLRLGQLDLLPAVLFALFLQAFARRLTLRLP